MFSFLLVLIMLVSIIPTPAVAADAKLTSTTTNSNTADGVFMQKTSTYDPATGMMDITIEAYTTGSVQSTIRTVPTDIVLVLDVSGSMEGSGMTAMTAAVSSFIDATKTQNDSVENTEDKHSIAIIKFADNSFPNNKMAIGNTFDENGYNRTQIIAGFTTADADGVSALKSAVNQLTATGPTAVDYVWISPPLSLMKEVKLTTAHTPSATK